MSQYGKKTKKIWYKLEKHIERCVFLIDNRDFMNTKQQKKVEDALIKKAVGYEVEELVEEFSVDDTQKPTLVKKKRSTKHFPPDISAIKILLSYYGEKTFD